jgi:hypothetical protein
MSKRGRKSRARDARQRARIAQRTQTVTEREIDDLLPPQLSSVDQAQRTGVPTAATEPVSSSSPERRGHESETVSTIPRRSVDPRRARPTIDTSRLAELVAARDAAQKSVDDEVGILRRFGADWAAIGRALGVSRQAARQRYG